MFMLFTRPIRQVLQPRLRVQLQVGRGWVIKSGDAVLYSGTYRQCEDWLDCHENA